MKLPLFFPKAVLHGGTAIWRCHGGNRFSEDLDFYLDSKERVEEFLRNLERQNFRVLKHRIKENSLYSLIEFNRTQVRVEAIFKGKKGAILKEYDMADGNLMTAYTLNAEELRFFLLSSFHNLVFSFTHALVCLSYKLNCIIYVVL